MGIRQELRGFVTGLSVAAGLVLLAISVDFGIPGQELLQSLRFHVVIALLPLPFVLGLSGAWLRASIVWGLLLLSAGQGGLIIARQLQQRPAATAQHASLALLSFNVLGNNQHADQVAAYLADAPHQVVVLLEALGIQRYLGDLSAQYPAMVGCAAGGPCDAAILSRLPVIESEAYAFGPFRRQRLVKAVVEVEGQRVTIVAAHLSKPYFDGASAEELMELARFLDGIRGPVVLAGDFNSAAWAGSVAELVDAAGLIPAPAFPATWPVELGALGLPIDNVFTRDGAVISSIAAMPDPLGSNHRGLLATIDVTLPAN